jgi:hypothetical protein
MPGGQKDESLGAGRLGGSDPGGQGRSRRSGPAAGRRRGVYGVFSVTDFWQHGGELELAHGKSLADAAQAAGV